MLLREAENQHDGGRRVRSGICNKRSLQHHYILENTLSQRESYIHYCVTLLLVMSVNSTIVDCSSVLEEASTVVIPVPGNYFLILLLICLSGAAAAPHTVTAIFL